tara:strand:+ start:205 stop:903 length:699 start_codon:yes stop_codon:yes gene_type:complete
MISISVVFPVHNEEKNIKKLIHEWHLTLDKSNIDHEFILVEDGSKDETKKIIKELETSYPIINLSQDERRGYSKAVVDGIFSSKKKFILCTDSDNQIKADSLINNLDKMPTEDQFLIGFRNPRMDPLNRIVYSKLFKLFHDILFRSKLKDPSCPFVIGLNETFKKLNKEKLLFMKEGFWWGFVGICLEQKFKIYEVPIKHFRRDAGEAGYKLGNLIGIIIRNLKGLIKIKIN